MRLRRARSPLRWLWVGTSTLGIFALAGITGLTWLVLSIPLVALALLFAPPLGVFRHDEAPPPRTGARLTQREVPSIEHDPPGATRLRLTLVNDGDVPAEGFRIRILVPAAIWPRGTRGTPLGALHVGALGRNWFVESVHDDTSVTFRAGLPAVSNSITCPPGNEVDLADLVLVNLAHFDGSEIEYQINGGTVRTVLGRIGLPVK